MSTTNTTAIVFSGAPLKIEDIVAISRRKTNVALSQQDDFQQRITRGAEFLERLLREQGEIYGVTTGYGDSCTTRIPMELVGELPKHLYTYHGCGYGDYLTPEQTRAVLATRLASLCRGYSGVSLELLTRLADFLNHDILPLIPSEGSVGASGDLTPLSYLAAALCGERKVLFQNQHQNAAEVLQACSLEPLRLRPKEGLALMNGTAVMTALACLAWRRADYLCRLSTRITAMACIVLQGNPHHFEEALFAAKPHAGQQLVAQRLREDLGADQFKSNVLRLQDRYSLRCAPHIIGVLQDALSWLRSWIENELNSANDNPLIDPHTQQVLHGGHFYGGHIAFAMDGLKAAIANLADLMDRQLALMVDTNYNHGLPANLSGAQSERAAINHGLKALQISVSAWTAEALKHTMPASVFSRSTECHNQDKVSMGTIAARDCLRVLQLTEQVAAAMLIACRQGIDLRRSQNAELKLAANMYAMQSTLCAQIEFIGEDRALESDLRSLVAHIQNEYWTLYE